jgi:hypothetical protein
MKHFLFTLLLLSIICIVKQSYGQVSFQKRYGTPGNESSYNGTCGEMGSIIKELREGGYIIVGSGSNSSAERNIILIKINSIGDTLWTRIMVDASTHLYANSVVETYDGGYAVGFFTTSPNYAGILRTDANGNTLWIQQYWYWGHYSTLGSALKQTPDSGFVLAAYEFSVNRIEIIKTDKNGQMIWGNGYGIFPPHGVVFDIELSEDGGYLVAGSGLDEYGVIMKVNSIGDVMWCKTYHNPVPEHDVMFYAIKRIHNGYLLCGVSTDHTTTTNEDMLLVKIDLSGNAVWAKSYGNLGIDRMSSVDVLDESFIFTGQSPYQVPLGKTDSLGNLMSAKLFGMGIASTVITTSDGGFIMAGYGPGAGGNDIHVRKAASFEDFNCNVNTTFPTTIILLTTDSLNISIIHQLAQDWYTLIVQQGLIVANICSTVSLNENENSKSSISIYPNPTTSTFTIALPDQSSLLNSELKIVDVTGRLAYTSTLNTKHQTLNPALSAGVYFVRVSDGERVFTEKLVVQ